MDDLQLTLGELIAALSPFPRDKSVRFDFEYARPTKLDSWRGVYAELALGFTFDEPADYVTVGHLLDHLRSAVGEVFHGYKGGEYVMGRDTPLWVANYGNCGTTAVQGVLDLGYEIVIVTGHCGRYEFLSFDISKPNTLPSEVISVMEELNQQDIDEAVEAERTRADAAEARGAVLEEALEEVEQIARLKLAQARAALADVREEG